MEKSSELEKPDYMDLKYTDYDPLKLKVIQDDKEIHLMTYRYAVPENIVRKGVAFFLTGYGGYFEQSAYLLKEFAESGYECFALDLRGFGNSEGVRAKIGTSTILYDDVNRFVQTALEQYSIDPKVTPLFLFGVSFGGLTSFNFAAKHEGLFKGLALVVPFFKAPGKALDRLQWLFKTIKFFSPNLTLKGQKEKIKEMQDVYPWIFKDPKVTTSIAISSVVMFKKMQDFSKASIKDSKTPFLMITAQKDTMVDNQRSYDLFKKSDNPQNKHIEIEEADHLSIFMGKQYSHIVVKETISYFDSLLQ